jgi:hypothetical protein
MCASGETAFFVAAVLRFGVVLLLVINHKGLVIYGNRTANMLAVSVLEYNSTASINLKVTLSTYASCRRIGEVKASVHSLLTFALGASC